MRPTLSTGQFQTLANRLAEYSGFSLDGSRHRSLESALAVRIEALGLDDTRTYLLQLDDAELHRLTELVVNHETQFFRTPAHHRALREEILPALHRERPSGQPLRCWSAGCATGEEPYSLAITALDVLGEPLPRPVEIYATDISAPALAKARAGRYRGRTLTNVGPDGLQRRFTADQGSFTIRPEVSALVRFEQHNLHAALPVWARSLDMISCQNVTIYFSVDVVRALMGRFFDVLTPGGYLFLGFSETLWRIFDRFETVEVSGAFVYRKPLPRVILSKPRPQIRERMGTRELRERRGTRELRSLSHGPALSSIPTPQRIASMRRQLQPEPVTVNYAEQGMALFKAGSLDEALKMLQQVKPDHQSYPQALATIARIHADRGAWEMAAAEARRAIELDVLTFDAHLLLGMLAANQERWDEAVTHLERVRYLEPRAPLPSFHLANAYRGQQQPDLAEREYRSTLRKLDGLEATEMLDGVTVAWLRETCQRFLQHLEADRLQQR
jgi:chemotaxis protein methyltransferase CheR